MLRSNIGETPKKQPFLRRGVKKNHIGFFDCRIYPLSPYEHSPNISSGTPHKATGHGRGESQNAVQKNKCIRCYPTLVLHYICGISEAVRHSQAENAIFACLCAHLSLYLQQIRRQTTVISNHPTLCTTCRLSYILPCKTQGKRLNSEIPCSVCTKTVKTN